MTVVEYKIISILSFNKNVLFSFISVARSKKKKKNETVDTERPSTLREFLLKDLKDEDELMGHIHETSTLSVDVDVKDDTDDVKHVPLPFSSTPVHSRSEPPEVLKPLSREPVKFEIPTGQVILRFGIIMKFNILKIFLQLQIGVEESFYTISITCSPHWCSHYYTNNSVFDNVYTVYAVPIFSWENPEVVHLQQNNSINNLEELPSLNDTLDDFSILQDITEIENSSITLYDDHPGRNFNIEQSIPLENQTHFGQSGLSLPSPQSHDPHDYIDMSSRSTDCSGFQSVNTSVHERHMQSTSTSSGPISVSSSNHLGYVAEEDYAHTHHNTQGQLLEYNHAFTHNLSDRLSTRGGTIMVSVTDEIRTADSTCILEVDPDVGSNNDSLRNLDFENRRFPIASIQNVQHRHIYYDQLHNSIDIAPNSERLSHFYFSNLHTEHEMASHHNEDSISNNVPVMQDNSGRSHDGYCNDPKSNESNAAAKDNIHFQSEIQSCRQKGIAESFFLSPCRQRINPELRHSTPNVNCRHPTRPPDINNTERNSPLSVAIQYENDLEKERIIDRLINKGYSSEAVERAIKFFIDTTGRENFTAEDLLRILRTE